MVDLMPTDEQKNPREPAHYSAEKEQREPWRRGLLRTLSCLTAISSSQTSASECACSSFGRRGTIRICRSADFCLWAYAERHSPGAPRALSG
jgi:hypothetical protein